MNTTLPGASPGQWPENNGIFLSSASRTTDFGLGSQVCANSVPAPASPSLRAAPEPASPSGGAAARPAVGIARRRAPPFQGRREPAVGAVGPVAAPGVAVAPAAAAAVTVAAAVGVGRAAAVLVVAASAAVRGRGPPRRVAAARVPVALEGVSVGAAARVVGVVAAAAPVAVAVAVASGREVVPGARVAVVAVGVLAGRRGEVAGVAGARVVSARVAVPGRVALLPGAQVGVPARGRLPARRPRVAISPARGRGPPAHPAAAAAPTAAAAGQARRRGPLRGRPGPARRRRAALQGHRGPGGAQVEIPRVAAVVGGPAPGRGAPRPDTAPAGPAQAPRAPAAAGRRQRAPTAALERRLGGLGHFDGLTIQGLAVHVADGGLGVGGALEGDEREAPGLAGFSVLHQEHLDDAAILAELGLEGFLVDFGAEPADEELPGAVRFHHVCGSRGQRGAAGGEGTAALGTSEPAG